MHTPMYALIRPALESYLRAMWVKYHLGEIPDDGDLTSLHFPKRIEELIKQVDAAVPEFKSNSFLENTIGPLIPNLHDYTHGGIQSIARQYSGSELSYARDKGELESISKLGVLISSLAYEELSKDNIGSKPLQTQEIELLARELLTLIRPEKQKI